MIIEVSVSKENYLELFVFICSLGINSSKHIDLIIDENDLSEEEKNSIENYALGMNISILDKPTDESVVCPTNLVFDNDVDAIFEELQSFRGEKTIVDYALNAPAAHDSGMKYEDVKGKDAVIWFPEDRPWQCTNIHFDIEKIWWEYAKKTPVYHELMECFLESAMNDTFLEDYAIKICNENDQLSKAIKEMNETIKAISSN